MYNNMDTAAPHVLSSDQAWAHECLQADVYAPFYDLVREKERHRARSEGMSHSQVDKILPRLRADWNAPNNMNNPSHWRHSDRIRANELFDLGHPVVGMDNQPIRFQPF